LPSRVKYRAIRKSKFYASNHDKDVQTKIIKEELCIIKEYL